LRRKTEPIDAPDMLSHGTVNVFARPSITRRGFV
jgi:hypothetical protein